MLVRITGSVQLINQLSQIPQAGTICDVLNLFEKGSQVLKLKFISKHNIGDVGMNIV